MEIYKTISEIKEALNLLKSKGLKIGFVPTMGALHIGHISLIKKSFETNEITVCSIFVNPTQFNNPEDLKKYPRTLEQDIKQLEAINCSILFLPDEQEMYPEKDNRIFDFDGIDSIMEGKFRPGHFNGVAQIVSKLFEIVRPNKAYFGIKDFQQLAIVNILNEKYLKHLKIQIVACEIIRELDGLAMSSRNVRLNSVERQNAAKISYILFRAKLYTDNMNIEELKIWVANEISKVPDLKLEYFEIVNSETHEIIENWLDAYNYRACIAVNVGQVRLIDNIKI